MIKTAAFGSWPSQLNAEQVARQAQPPREMIARGDDLYWLEPCTLQQGRTRIMGSFSGGHPRELLPAGFDCRSRVHEYGGGAYTVTQDTGLLYFSNALDNQIYQWQVGSDAQPQRLSCGDTGLRFASLALDSHHSRLLAVAEDHRADGEAINSIVALRQDGDSTALQLVAGEDFYSSPLPSPDGRQLCWVSWSHPDMPWDSSSLWLASLDSEGIGSARRIAGGPGESVCQPLWSPTGVLHFLADRTGWWNLYRWRNCEAEPLAPSSSEFAAPPWVFGQSNYCFDGDRSIIASHCRDGIWQLTKVDCASGKVEELDSPYHQINQLCPGQGKCWLIGATVQRETEIASFTVGRPVFEPMHVNEVANKECASEAQPICYITDTDQQAHGFFYPPVNTCVEIPIDELPPLLVIAHGGPTGAASPGYNAALQFWTSRGFAVLAVNYRGSANYGRSFRQQLNGQWGVADAVDCVAGAQYLAREGLVDPRRMAIRGNSAGGFTVLSALAFHDVFAAGASYYGVSDLERLAMDTHKFESRYMDALLGPLPECSDIYRKRSPLHHAQQINCPVIFFQGLEDKIVPPNQTREMAAALRERQIPVTEINFEGEAHGFRRADNIVAALLAELHFYGRIFGFQPADPLPPGLATQLPPASPNTGLTGVQ